MRAINGIIIHCSATPPGMDIGVKEIRKWHKDRGWSDIGYHFVIRRNGSVQRGRGISRMGAHTRGHNRDTIGICLVGGINDKRRPQFNYTVHQIVALETLVNTLSDKYGIADGCIFGHNQFSNKACPVFSVPDMFGTVVIEAHEKDRSDTEGF